MTARSAGSSGQGVLIVGTNRAADLPLLNDRRLAQSDQGNADTRAAFYSRLETLMGTPDQVTSLNGRVAALTSALTAAVSHPESEPGLSTVVSAAKSLVSSISATSKDIQAARKDADHEIASEISQLNDSLEKAYKLNLQIFKSAGTGKDTSALQDQRQQIIDQIAQIVPLREVQQMDGSVSLYTTGGAVLLDSKPAVFGFTATSVIVPAMTQQAGGLSGLTLNGRSIVTSGESSVILGGSLAANFAVRDDIAPAAQAQVDSVARDLVERFQDTRV
ncbi:MAG: flagellar hook-associated protein FlgK, partial [Rhodobacterales bacterium 17-64-5]